MDDVPGQTQRQPAPPSRSLFQYIEKRKYLCRRLPAVPESMGRQQHENHEEFLVWYNNKEVVPMLEALEKMFQFYKNRHIDMFKDGISVPGLTLKYMFQDLQTTSPCPMKRIKICSTYTRTTSLGARTSCFIGTTRKTRPSYDPRNTTIPSHASLSSASTPMHFIYGQSCRTCRLDISFSEKTKQASGGKRPEGMSAWPSIGWSGKLCSPVSPFVTRVMTPKN